MPLGDRATPSQPPRTPPTAARRHQHAELEGRGVQHLLAVQHDRRRSDLAEHVEEAEGDGERAQQRVVPQPAEPLGELVLERRPRRPGPRPARPGRRGRRWRTRARRRRRTSRRRTKIGSTKPAASSRLASGGPTNWLATISAEYIWPLACSRSASSTIAGRNVWALLSWSTSHVPSSIVATSEHDVEEPLGADDLVDLVRRRQRAAAGPSTATATSAVSTKRTVLAPTISRRRSLRSVITPAGSVNSSHGRRWTTATRAISSGLRVTAVANHG